ncbi:centrosomal protein of 95 kDa-like isoform X2 [Xyrauchen texanus]|uniref:centrosomal protein of 95 kDa-like isoform X2 n=1 Tax=Xyrauchen texanus TaxID=154827 RepID=UPI002241ABC1|nr:centrosomal protein of 95 kDa-like isoform X2 [Xyrauchen texanus]
MGPEDMDWVDVANNLLLKCHTSLRLEKITDCDANVFVALYQDILGEKVPDYVDAHRQEDDIHNVQSVVDSLALDYLHISLSHITGENIVRGDKESIRNLLEIFDGLLDYLTEQLSDVDEPKHGELNGETHTSTAVLQHEEQDREEMQSLASSIHSAVQSSKHSLHSWNGDESESTTELIRLGDSACTFAAKHEVLAADLPVVETLETDVANTHAILLREPLRPAIALQPPYQRPTPSSDMAMPPRDQAIQHPENPQQEMGITDLRLDLICTQPDVLLQSLRDELHENESEGQNGHREEENEKREREQANKSPGLCTVHRDMRQCAGLKSDRDKSLSMCSQRNKEAEQELHDMSEKLSRRLEELDLMLKHVLGEIGETSEPREEDKQSYHSDSIMECRRTPKPTGTSHSSRYPGTRSPSPPPAHHSLQRENTLIIDSCKTNHSQLVASAYEDEPKLLVEQERADLTTDKLCVQKSSINKEHEYHHALCRKDPSVPSSSSKSSCSRSSQPKLQQIAGRHTLPCKTGAMRVKENDLLPVLVEEFPQVQLSPHALSCMWKQQLRQIDQLNRPKKLKRHTQSKLSNQLEEAQKRHDMLVQIIHKEQEHNCRLREFRERIQQQKSAQNKLREQRQQVACAKKYYNDYHVQLRARLMRARTREERMLRQIFEDGMELQKAHLREQRAFAKELRQDQHRKHRDEIHAMENYYRDQVTALWNFFPQTSKIFLYWLKPLPKKDMTYKSVRQPRRRLCRK